MCTLFDWKRPTVCYCFIACYDYRAFRTPPVALNVLWRALCNHDGHAFRIFAVSASIFFLFPFQLYFHLMHTQLLLVIAYYYYYHYIYFYLYVARARGRARAQASAYFFRIVFLLCVYRIIVPFELSCCVPSIAIEMVALFRFIVGSATHYISRCWHLRLPHTFLLINSYR